MYVLLTGTPPFNGRNDREILDRVRSGRYSMNKPQLRYVSADAKNLMQWMLTFDPARRPSAQECYNHKWFKNEHKKDKKKLHRETLANFKHFHVNLTFLKLSIEANSKEHFISS